MKPETLLFDAILNDLDALLEPADRLSVKESNCPIRVRLWDLMIKIDSECQTVTEIIYNHNIYNIKYLLNEVHGIKVTKIESLEETQHFTPEQKYYAISNLEFDLNKEPYNQIGTHQGVDYFITQLGSLTDKNRKLKALDLLRTTFLSHADFNIEELKLTPKDNTYSLRGNSMRRSIYNALLKDLKDSYKIDIDSLKEIETGYKELGNKVREIYNQVSTAIRQLQRHFILDSNNDKLKLIGHYEIYFEEYFKGVSQIIKNAVDKFNADRGKIYTPGVEITPDFIKKEIHKINFKFALSINKEYYMFYIILAQTTLDIIARITELKVSEGGKNTQQEAETIAVPQTAPGDPYQFIKDTLKPLSGKWFSQGKIMSENDYQMLLNGLIYLVENAKLSEIKSIGRTPATNDFIKHTIYKIYKHYGKNKTPRGLYLSFIKRAFRQFDNVEERTLNSKFSNYEANNYETLVNDLQQIS